jgi:hypothetical protein
MIWIYGKSTVRVLDRKAHNLRGLREVSGVTY